jgi:CheY-like chemotaxis protein
MQSRLQVLVVDDEIIVATAIEELLSGYGHNVTVAFDTGEAMAAVARLETLDAVVLDLQLPDGPGAELLAALRSRWPALPAVISTGYALDAAERAAFEPLHGRTVVLKKPWTEAQLLATLAEVAGEPVR